jgi:hypothetical protein
MIRFSKTTSKHLLRGAMAIAMLAGAAKLGEVIIRACSGSSETIYIHTLQPDHDQFDRFAKGELGLLQPSFARSYAVVAYRHLSGASMDEAAQKDVLRLWWERAGLGPKQDNIPVLRGFRDISDASAWREARKKVKKADPSLPAPQWNNTYSASFPVNTAGFQYAANTLEMRLKGRVVDDPLIQAWVDAQDQVFSVKPGAELSLEIPAGAPEWFKQDRNYQRAAGLYYATQFQKAAAAFETIAKDRRSPHSDLAAYLVARSFLRLARSPQGSPEHMMQAKRTLENLLKDASRKSVHESASELLDRIAYLSGPEAYLEKLGQKLSAKGSNPHFHDDLDSYTYAWDRLSGEDGKTEFTLKDGLSLWIHAVETGKGAEEAYLAKPNLPWLIAALMHAEPGSKTTPRLLADAEKVDSKSPAYLTAQYHRVRLLIALGKQAEAQKIIALFGNAQDTPVSFQNALRVQRQRLARNFQDYLKLLPLKPVGTEYDGAGSTAEPTADAKPELPSSDLLTLQTQVPVELLRDSALDARVDENLKLPKLALEKAMWLDRVDVLNALLPAIPEETDLIELLANAKDADERRFIVGLREGRIRNKSGYSKSVKDALPIPVLTKTQQTKAAEEQTKLDAIDNAVIYHCKNVLAYAEKHPDNPNAPEALHQVIQLTRNNYDDSKVTSNLSRRCFQFLHKQYPKNEWTAKTRFYY